MAAALAVNDEKDALRGIGGAPGFLKVSMKNAQNLLPRADGDHDLFSLQCKSTIAQACFYGSERPIVHQFRAVMRVFRQVNSGWGQHGV
jgi:hypothetical protein